MDVVERVKRILSAPETERILNRIKGIMSAPETERLLDRVKRITLSPKTEWDIIEQESTSVFDLYRHHIMILAAVPAIANFLGNWLFGFSRASGWVHMSFTGSFTRALVQYALTLPMIYLVALVVSKAASSFEGKQNDLNALKLVAYSYTPAWLAGVFGLIPGLRWLDFLGLYSVYLFYVGVARLMKCREDYVDVYTLTAAVAGLVAAGAHGLIVHFIAPAPV